MITLLKKTGDRNFGFLLGVLIVLNLAAGSLVMNFYPSEYPRFSLLDFQLFFEPIKALHTWFYSLLVVFTLFGLNILVCTIELFIKLLRSASNRRRLIAALLVHVSILLALIGHVHEGIMGESKQMRIGSKETELRRIGSVTINSITRKRHPDGSTKDVEAILRVKNAKSGELKKTISHNRPAIFNFGMDQVLLFGGKSDPVGLIVSNSNDNQRYTITTSRPLILPGVEITLKRIIRAYQNIPFAVVRSQTESGSENHFLALENSMTGHKSIRVGNTTFRFVQAIEKATAIVMVRHNPSIPYMLISVLLLGVGILILIRSS